ncbi:hypothetical protein MycrhN_2547 [Mycolicibacterium rhodesiae NBB3]|uniref:Uncharacterized protein n=1 Tax=Mycolicibacterium rhodesiae (strain NBB3) TaxID=710685 RepID=G8RX84_MYCRN|nr:hypothetical protein MycrhN_2547 [Mycolicibacterium rhodesiae NBB3]
MTMSSTDASNDEPVVFADEWNRGNPLRRCVAKSSRTGKRCKRWAIKGSTVCPTHGGSTASVKRKARERIERAADRLSMELLGIATSAESEAVRLAAVRDALDRAGLNPKTAVEVEVGLKPFQKIFTGIDRGLRRDGTRAPAPSLPAPPALAPATAEIMDAEVVDVPAAGAERPYAPTAPANEGDARKRPPPWRNEKPSPQRRPSTELQTLEAANADLARDGIRPPARRRRGRA